MKQINRILRESIQKVLKESEEDENPNIDLLAKHIESSIDGLYNYKDLIRDVNKYKVRGRAGMKAGQDPEYAFGDNNTIYHVTMDKKYRVTGIKRA